MRRTLLKAFVVVLLASGVVLAQDDLSWLENLLPDESTRQLSKVLRQGELAPEVGDLLLNETFSALNAWETYTSRTGSLRITDGRYEIRFREQDLLLWGQNSAIHEDVAIEVETRMLSISNNNGYGIICLADPANTIDGYYFLISGEGRYTIYVFEGGTRRDLIPWTASDAINQGFADNHLIAVCNRDYLAFYANDQLLGETRDGTFAAGNAGMAATIFVPDEDVYVVFDNLKIWQLSGAQSDEELAVRARLENAQTAVALGPLAVVDDFSDGANWSTYDRNGTLLRVEDGVLLTRTVPEDGQVYTSWYDIPYDDVVIQVDAELPQPNTNGYGIVCQANSEDSNGYYFTLSGDQFYTFFIDQGAEFAQLVDWEQLDEISPER
ncbi:MAG: hypothetical protein KC496_04050, partial [Anaerolineae bacterium]|nr:hypothetical protein [Anaerolineae bacterium]